MPTSTDQIWAGKTASTTMAPDSEVTRSRPLRPFAPVLLGNLLLRVAGAATGLMLTLYLGWINRELYPVSATTLGLLAGGYYLVEMVSAPVLGAQSDRRGRRPFLMLGPALGFVAVQLTGLTTALAVLFLTRLLEGVAGAATTPALLGQLSAETEGDGALRGRVMSLFEAGTALGLTLGAVGGSLLWEWLGRIGFFAVGLVYLASLGLFCRSRTTDDGQRAIEDQASAPASSLARPRSSSARPAGLVDSVRASLRYGPLLQFMPAWLAINAIVGLWLTHAVFQMTAGRQLEGQYLVGAFPSGTIAIILAAYTLTFGVGIWAWGYAFRWLAETSIMRITTTAMLAATAFLALINHSGGPGPLLWLAVAGFALSVLVESGFAPAAVSHLARLSARLAEDRGLVMGLYSVVLGLGQLLGGWIGGPFADRWGIDGILVLTAALALVALALTLRLRSDL